MSWSATGPAGAAGSTVLSGTGAPAPTAGRVGDFYLDTTAWRIYGPKTQTGWPAPHALTGPAGAAGNDGSNGTNGTDGTNGNTVRSGPCTPLGSQTKPLPCPASSKPAVDGDFFIDTTNWRIFGPLTDDGWGSPTSLIGPDGTRGASVLSGACAANGSWNIGQTPPPCPPEGVGKIGDFFIDTTNWRIFGPLTAAGWGSPTSLIGPKGTDGNDGASVLSGACAANGSWNIGQTPPPCPPEGVGKIGDFFIDTTNWQIFGPLTAAGWGSPTSLIGPAGTGAPLSDLGDLDGITCTTNDGASGTIATSVDSSNVVTMVCQPDSP